MKNILFPILCTIIILFSLRSATSLLLVRSEAFTYKILHHENINLQELNPAVPKVNLVYVEGGTFTMGANNGDSRAESEGDEKPTRRVTLSDYYIMDTEVTQELWTWVMDNNPSQFKSNQNPVETFSWKQGQTFIQRLNQRRAEIDPRIVEMGLIFAMPTEAEWEFAARGGNKSKGYLYSGSNNIDEVALYRENSGNRTHPVGRMKPNELGLYDMSGNVWEWCSDWKATYPPYAETNPIGPASGDYHVLRGGGWKYNEGCCRISNRFGDPGYGCSEYGLRLVLHFI